MEPEQRQFRADPLKLRRLRIAANVSAKDIQKQTGLSKDTVRKLLQGEPVFLSTLADTVRTVFGIDDANEVLHPEELAKLGVQTEVSPDGQVLEWKIEAYLTGWKETSNGLQYQLARLGHRFLGGRLARGKCYELRHLTTAERDVVETHLRRHVEVCDRIGEHPNIAKNLTAAYVNNLWWVLDVWEDGETLADRLTAGQLDEYPLKFIMTGIAEALARLHEVDIIRRELTPNSVILRASSDRPVLTDMELAKIAEAGATVSPKEWPDDPYRALEVTGNTPIDIRADIYSWGRIFIHAATGGLCERGSETLPTAGDIPESVKDIALQSVELLPEDRPENMKLILKALKGWI
jgi:serine/threonine protein kinase